MFLELSQKLLIMCRGAHQMTTDKASLDQHDFNDNESYTKSTRGQDEQKSRVAVLRISILIDPHQI